MTTIMPDTVSADLRATLKALKLGQMPGTLPDRLTLARQQHMTHADCGPFLVAAPWSHRAGKRHWTRPSATSCAQD